MNEVRIMTDKGEITLKREPHEFSDEVKVKTHLGTLLAYREPNWRVKRGDQWVTQWICVRYNDEPGKRSVADTAEQAIADFLMEDSE